MTKEVELRQLVVRMTEAMRPAGVVLATIAQSRSPYSEDAWAAFSRLTDALNEVRALVERDMAEKH